MRFTVIDITGERFNHLTALSYVPRKKWLCKCDCGNERIVCGSWLRSGKAFSCGCARRPRLLIYDLTGKRFGRWTVLARVANVSSSAVAYKCCCDCGTERVVRASLLVRGKSQSCGCLLKFVRANTPAPNRKPNGYASLRAMFHGYKNGARDRNLCFELSWNDFQQITSQPCHFCGAVKGNTYSARKTASPFRGSGIDRYDNTLGYTIENSVPCCTTCNFLKGTIHGDKFIELCRTVANNHLPLINTSALWSSIERIM